MKYTSLLAFMLLSRLFLFAQNDTLLTTDTPVVYNGFHPYKSLLQLSIGGNVPGVGSFGRFEKPFYDGFANKYGTRVYVNTRIYVPIRQNGLVTGGISFMRNDFSAENFVKGAAKQYGDTLSPGSFLYESFAFWAGLSYVYTKKRIMFSGTIGAGALYTFVDTETEIFIDYTPGTNSTGYYKGGTMQVGNSVEPLIILDGEIKYFLKGDMYVVGGANFILSQVDLEVREWDDYYRKTTTHDFLKGNIPFQNLALSIGVGTVFR